MKVPARPCPQCPWRRDVQPGQFPATRYDVLRNTSGTQGREAGIDAPWFACHKSPEGVEYACAGWLAAVGIDHLGVRLAVALGHVPGEALAPQPGWPELFDTYAEMAETQGVDDE